MKHDERIKYLDIDNKKINEEIKQANICKNQYYNKLNDQKFNIDSLLYQIDNTNKDYNNYN